MNPGLRDLLVLALLGAAVAGYSAARHWHAVEVAQGGTGAAAPSVTPPENRPPVLPSKPPPAPPGARLSPALPVAVSMVEKLRRRKALRRAWMDSQDDLIFVRSLLSPARASDSEAQMQIAAVLANCAFWERPDRHGRTQRQNLAGPGNTPEVRANIERALTKCDPLETASTDEVGTREDWLRLAADAGDGQALLVRAEEADNRSAEDRVADLHRAIASGDPEVLLLIAFHFAYLADGYSWRALPAEQANQRRDVFNAALDLAQCRLGEDCSAQAMQENCAADYSHYDCSYAQDVSNYYELHLSATDFADARDFAQQLGDHFLSGAYDWPEAKSYEDSLRKPARRPWAG